MAISHHRRRRLIRWLPFGPGAAEPADDSLADTVGEREQLAAALRSIGPRHAGVLLLRHQLDLPIEDVAESLGVRAVVLKRIETRQHRARLGQGVKLLAAVTACVLFTLVLAAILRGGAPSLSDDDPGRSVGQSVGGGATETPAAEAEITASPTLAPASATVCLPGIVTNAAGGAGQELPANAFQIWVVVEPAAGCGPLAEDVTISLVDANGAPLAVEGNPITLPVISLSSRPLTYAGVVWENWCGAPGASVEALHGMGGAGRSLDATPVCADSAAPSRLTASDMPPPADAWPSQPTATLDAGCALSLSSLEMTQEPVGDDVVITVSGLPATTCREGATLTISLVDDSGALLDVDNNPATVPVHRMGDDERLYAGVTWSNWCGDAPVLLALQSKAGDAGEAADLMPACVDPNAPSRLVWESYADAAVEDPLPVCTAEDIGFTLALERSHGDVIIATNAGTEDLSGNVIPECLLPADGPTFTITDAVGNPLAIVGNGLVIAFSAAEGSRFAAPVAGFAHAAWENWCETPAAAIVHATFGDATAALTIDTPPDCDDDSAPSTLRSLSSAVPATETEAVATATP